MGENSKIQWTDHTFNPWWGCQRVSPGCEHCYAEAFAKRTGHKVWGPESADVPRRFFGDAHWNEPRKWNAAAEAAGVRMRVFCASMADVFEDRRDLDAQRWRLFGLIDQTPHLDWLLLTKRPENMANLAFAAWQQRWPSNVWAGTTVEDQRRADERIPHLLRVPAAVRFLSCEPLLGPVDLGTALRSVRDGRNAPNVDWVIVGGESGGGARPFHLTWARSIVAQCKAAEVATFVKQLGAHPHDPARDELGNTTRPALLTLNSRKGDDVAEWPADLRIREWPESAR